MADGMTMRLGQMVRAVKTPTPLLQFLAGPHAERIAACWPAPHDCFFALPAARRHAAVILLSHGGMDFDVLARLVERHKDADIARKLVAAAHGPSAEVPAGLMKAMARMGETQWQLRDYDLFLDLFRDEQASPVLRHMADIRPEKLALIGALPAGLREASIVALVPNGDAARDLGLACDIAVRMQGEQHARRIAERLRRAKESSQLFAKAAEELAPERFTPPLPVPALPRPFEAVTERKQLAAIALEFQNCLRDFAYDMALGRMAVFAWRVEPAIVLALRWDAAGWRLAEAECKANTDAPDASLRELVSILARFDVRTGPALATLERRLNSHAHGHAESIGDSFRDRLELGELWD
ncbi:MAG: hypothetical protein AAGJ32_11850 [Pseudomonadota bacterium]